MALQMYDYLVIGGGSAGCVLAARLSEDADTRVALVEAGPADDSVLLRCPAGLAVLAQTGRFNWAFDSVPQPGLDGRRNHQPRGQVLGGSSAVNAMIYMRGHPLDYQRWAAAGNPGWGWDDVLPHFLRAEHNERGADAWHAQGGPLNVADLRSPNPFALRFVEAARQAGIAPNPDFNGATQEGAGLHQVTQRNGERWSAARAYLAPARGRPNLDVLTDARVTRVIFEGRRAVGVELLQAPHGRPGGVRRELRARREVLLCAGAFQSPQLLLLSGVGPGPELQALGLPVVHHLPGVGLNLHDHPDVIQVHEVPGGTDLFGVSVAGAWRVVKAMQDWRARRTGLLTTNFAEAGAFVRSDPALPQPDLQLHFVIGKLVDHGRRLAWGHGFSCHVCVLQPRSRGRVSLAVADPLAAPRIDLGLLSDAEDLRRLVHGFRLMRQVLQQPALAGCGAREQADSAAAVSDAQIARYVRQHADTIYHPVGSCRMGPGPDDVVDARLRVKGLEALRVVDASVMPEVVSGNTHAPVVMIAEKAAGMIRHDACAA